MFGITLAILLGYWALLGWAPFPDVRPVPGDGSVITRDLYKDVSQLKMDSTNILHGSYVQGVNIVNYFDQRFLPGRRYDGTYDPEGILSTIPAFATGLLGIFAGLLLQNKSSSTTQKVQRLILAGIALVVLGYFWGTQFPIIKKLWTSSYVLVAGGYSAMLLGIFYWMVDVRKWQTWCEPFVWIGMNPITLYLASNFMGGLGFEKLATRLAGGSVKLFLNGHLATGVGDLVLSLVGIFLFTLFARFLYQRKIFLRL
jgi:predicted acyltransferase